MLSLAWLQNPPIVHLKERHKTLFKEMVFNPVGAGLGININCCP
ncbi:hypothetical protein MC7420_3984 [Coleofasciculus chthonoplastes PCC 7420]|uniref:Uncharacterized protein n=1 Tax=Coleofasciculus chthonoplastes PCC 7420 TaxID=118168 RepID=B4VUS6_9CYAN|nr:hypothetical protein MC7420_3984 [Coleofasciculus chthonoplastes PCC 7420]